MKLIAEYVIGLENKEIQQPSGLKHIGQLDCAFRHAALRYPQCPAQPSVLILFLVRVWCKHLPVKAGSGKSVSASNA
jgi:hypothetical protein